jgi:hypothetical protein
MWKEKIELTFKQIFSREERVVEERGEDLGLYERDEYQELLNQLENIIEELRKLISSQN